MRLWHQDLIHHLPEELLLKLHRDCCDLRGRQWGKNHKHVEYVFKHPRSWLFVYHCVVLDELQSRGRTIRTEWTIHTYCGRSLGYVEMLLDPSCKLKFSIDYDYFVKLRQNLSKHPDSSSWATRRASKFNNIAAQMAWDAFGAHERDRLVYLEHDDAYLKECLMDLKQKNVELVGDKTLEEFFLELAIQGK